MLPRSNFIGIEFFIHHSSNFLNTVPYAGVPYNRSDYQTLDTTNEIPVTTKPLPPAGIPNTPYVKMGDTNRRDNDLMTFTFPAWAPPPDSDDDQDDDNNAEVIFNIRQPSELVFFFLIQAHSLILTTTDTSALMPYRSTHLVSAAFLYH